jgi:putative chitinase
MLDTNTLAFGMKCPLARAAKWVDAINAAMIEFDILTPMRQAHFLAQVGHESEYLFYTTELASGRAYNGRVDLGNMRPEALAVAKAHNTTAGEFWRGHGLIQTTGFDNHKACGEALGLDLVNNPLLLTVPVNAARSAGYFWKKHNLNPLADMDLLTRITKIVNGGQNGIDDRRMLLTSFKIALGI